MTLVAAWITPEFRIVASDSLTTDKNGNPVKGNPQKVFSSKKLAIGFFGDLGFRVIEFKNELINKKMSFEDWDLNSFRQKLQDILKNEYLTKFEQVINSDSSLETEILAIPKVEDAIILRVKHNKIQDEVLLSDYKSKNSVGNIGDLFFSSQTLSDDKVDFEHQRNLLENFKYILNLPDSELNIKMDLPLQVKQLTKLVSNAMDDKNERLYRKNIGGSKVFYAFSFKGQIWQTGIYELV